MPFSNPIVAGEELIRSAIRSENYIDDGDTGIGSGWQIARDGTASFYSLFTRGSASGPTATYDSVFANDSFTYKGDELQGLLDVKPRGFVAFGFLNPSLSYQANNTRVALLELQWPGVAGRAYRIYTSQLLMSMFTAGRSGQMFITATFDGTQPGINSTRLGTEERYEANANVYAAHTLNTTTFGSGLSNTYRALLVLSSVNNNQGIIELNNYGSPLYMFVEDIGLSVPNTGIDRTSGGAPPPPLLIVREESSTGSTSFYGSGSVRTVNAEMYQGQSGGGPGNQYSRIDIGGGFKSALAAASTIQQLDMYLRFDHWWYGSGGVCNLGWVRSTDNVAFPNVMQIFFARGEAKWINLLGTQIGGAIDAGDFGSFLIGPAAPNDLTHYGIARGAFRPDAPGLRARYYA